MKYLVFVLNPERPIAAVEDSVWIRTPTTSFDTREDAEKHRLELIDKKARPVQKVKELTRDEALQRIRDCRITSLGQLPHGYVIYESVAVQLINELLGSGDDYAVQED